MKDSTELINFINQSIKQCQDFEQDMQSCSWQYQEGVILSGNEAIQLIELIKTLESDKESLHQLCDDRFKEIESLQYKLRNK